MSLETLALAALAALAAVLSNRCSPATLQALEVVRREVVADADDISGRKLVELLEDVGGVGPEADVGVDDDQLRQVREDPVIEGHQVEYVVVVFGRKLDLEQDGALD